MGTATISVRRGVRVLSGVLTSGNDVRRVVLLVSVGMRALYFGVGLLEKLVLKIAVWWRIPAGSPCFGALGT